MAKPWPARLKPKGFNVSRSDPGRFYPHDERRLPGREGFRAPWLVIAPGQSRPNLDRCRRQREFLRGIRARRRSWKEIENSVTYCAQLPEVIPPESTFSVGPRDRCPLPVRHGKTTTPRLACWGVDLTQAGLDPSVLVVWKSRAHFSADQWIPAIIDVRPWPEFREIEGDESDSAFLLHKTPSCH